MDGNLEYEISKKLIIPGLTIEMLVLVVPEDFTPAGDINTLDNYKKPQIVSKGSLEFIPTSFGDLRLFRSRRYKDIMLTDLVNELQVNEGEQLSFYVRRYT